MIKLILVDPDPEFAHELELAVAGAPDIAIAVTAPGLNGLSGAMADNQPAVTVLGPNLDDETVIAFVKAHADEGGFVVFAVDEAAQVELSGYPQCRLAEAPLSKASFIALLREAYPRLEPPTPAAPKNGKLGRMVTVFSTKGGVGKTTLASNLAAYFADSTDLNVVAIDLDLQFGDIGVMLGLKPEHTIYDCLPVAHELTDEMLDRFLTPHESGVRALLAPLQPEMADLITGDHLKNILAALRRSADIIVVDTPAAFNDHVLTVLDATDLALLVATMDIPSVKNIKVCLQTMKSLQYPDEQIALTINRVDRDLGLKLYEIEHALATKALVTIPNDKRVPWSVNKGVPIVLDAPRSPAGKSLITLGDKLLERLMTGKMAAACAIKGEG